MESSFGQYLAYLRGRQGRGELAEASVEAYWGDLVRFSAYLVTLKKGVVDVVSDDVQNWVEQSLKPEGLGARALVRKLVSVRGFYRFLLEAKWITEDPTASVSLPKLPRVIANPLPPGKIEELLATPPRHERRGCRDYAMLMLLVETGLRVSELVGLTRQMLDLEQRMVRVYDQAGKPARLLSFTETTCEAIHVYLVKVRPHWVRKGEVDAVFVTDRGHGLTRQGFWKAVGRYGQALGLDEGEITPQKLRNFFAARALSEGAELRHVQQAMGHADVESTRLHRLLPSRAGFSAR